MAFLTKLRRSSPSNTQTNNVDLKEHEEQIEKEPNFVKASETKVEGIDFVAPSLIKETLPSDLIGDGTKINDYYVEVGGTTEFARYFRSFLQKSQEVLHMQVC